MKIALVHNTYLQPGGEDEVFEAEAAILRNAGHDVVKVRVHNSAIQGMSKPALLSNTIWNRRAARDVRIAVRRERVEVVHCHNIFPLISPSIYYAARAEGVPVVQTLHNYRLL